VALFRILKGQNQHLPTTSTEGWMYITEDTGDIHLFTSTTNRLHLNANYANKLRDSTNGQTLLDKGDQGQAVYFVGGIPAVCRRHVDLETDQEIDGKKYFLNQVSVNETDTSLIGTHAFYVKDTVRFAIGSNDNTAHKSFIIGSPGNRYLSFGGGGI
jgi:hypothetical protein